MGTSIVQCHICGNNYGSGNGPALSITFRECRDCQYRLNVMSSTREQMVEPLKRERAYNTINRIVRSMRWR